MQKNSTLELLVKHLYNETTNSESKFVADTLKSNIDLQEEFIQMQATKYALDDFDGDEPDQSIIANIINYSKKSTPEMV